MGTNSPEETPTVENFGEILKEAVFDKQSHSILHHWQKRAFRLHPKVILYSDPKAWNPKLHQRIDIMNITQIDMSVKMITIATNQKTYKVRMKTEDEAKDWLKAFQELFTFRKAVWKWNAATTVAALSELKLQAEVPASLTGMDLLLGELGCGAEARKFFGNMSDEDNEKLQEFLQEKSYQFAQDQARSNAPYVPDKGLSKRAFWLWDEQETIAGLEESGVAPLPSNLTGRSFLLGKDSLNDGFGARTEDREKVEKTLRRIALMWVQDQAAALELGG